MNKRTIENILLTLLMSCSMTSFNMNGSQTVIPEGQLFKHSDFHLGYHPVNTKKNRRWTFSIEEPKREKIVTWSGTLTMKNGKLCIKTEKKNHIPVEGSVPLTKLQSWVLTPLKGRDFTAFDNHGNVHIINKIDIDPTVLSSSQKRIAVRESISYRIGDSTVAYPIAAIKFTPGGFNRIEYGKNNKRTKQNEPAQKWFNETTLPFTQEQLELIAKFQKNGKSFALEIYDQETKKDTIFHMP